MQKWEYAIKSDPSEAELDEMGMRGWELVTVVAGAGAFTGRLNGELGPFDFTGSSNYWAYLKRAIEN